MTKKRTEVLKISLRIIFDKSIGLSGRKVPFSSPEDELKVLDGQTIKL